MALPPWLNIQPSDYLQAAHSGAQLGMQIAAAQNRAQEAAAARDLQLREQAQRQWEFQENLRQRASELAANREEAAARLEEANRYHLASVAEAQAGHEAQAAHWRQMEEAAKLDAERKAGQATIVEHPEIPGMQFLRNPSGAETPVVRPEKVNDLERTRLGLSLHRAMIPTTSETAADPSFLSRSNYAAGELSRLKLSPPLGSSETNAPAAQPSTPLLLRTLPYLPTDIQRTLAAPPRPSPSAGTKVTTGKRVRVKNPEGKPGTVSEENLQEALDAGYTEY